MLKNYQNCRHSALTNVSEPIQYTAMNSLNDDVTEKCGDDK